MKKIITSIFLSVVSLAAIAQGYTNPIIPGFNPDPSVCRVGDDYYLVTSSFQYFPGVPLYHSKDLVNWEQLGHVLNRHSQLPLNSADSWGGIYAPTIRHHNGRFYMITTNCSDRGNFIVWTDDINSGEWSEPNWVKMPGIDPDLFWDEDGTCYFTGCANDGIMQCKINPDTGEILSKPRMIWTGMGGRYPEAPHIYKKDGMYYLLIAEGGTEFGHAVTIARSRFIDGPYTPAPHNPILTHFKQATQTNPIQGTGHADIIQAHDGSWWVVCLGFRVQDGNHHVMGRETFLAPVTWDRGGWPVINGNGDFTINMDVPTLPQKPFGPRQERWDFDNPETERIPESSPVKKTGLGPEWSWIRGVAEETFELADGKLRMYGNSVGLDSKTQNPSFVGYRQQDMNFIAQTYVDMKNSYTGCKAGLTVFMDAQANYNIYVKKGKGGKWYAGVHYSMGEINHVDEVEIKGPKAYLRITGEPTLYRLWYSEDGKDYKMLGKGNTHFLSSETAGGFTGVMIGLWSHMADSSRKGYADFEYFEYKGE